MGLFKNSSHDKIVRYLIKKGFEVVEGSSHSKATNDDSVFITIPRHNKISVGVTNQIAALLINECGFPEREVYKAINK